MHVESTEWFFGICVIGILTDAAHLGHWHEKQEIKYLISAVSPVCDRKEISQHFDHVKDGFY